MNGDWLTLGAVALLAAAGAARQRGSRADPRKRYGDLKRLAAPDSGATANERAMAQRLLAKMTPPAPQQPTTSSTGWRSQPSPPWQTDARSAYNQINLDNFTDLNFAKKAIYEHASAPRVRVTFQPFDGSYGRASISAYSALDDLGYGAMVTEAWTEPFHKRQGYLDAVLATIEGRPGEVRIVRIRGRDVSDENRVLTHDSFNDNPFNDTGFRRVLQQQLAQWQ